jgi:hypothetical protein
MVRTYSLDFEELLGLARSRLTRSLTTEECERYLPDSACLSTPLAWPLAIPKCRLFKKGQARYRSMGWVMKDASRVKLQLAD